MRKVKYKGAVTTLYESVEELKKDYPFDPSDSESAEDFWFNFISDKHVGAIINYYSYIQVFASEIKEPPPKDLLQTGMIATHRNGKTSLIVKDNCCGVDAVIFSDNNWTDLKDFNENLKWMWMYETGEKRSDHTKGVDIIKISKPFLPTEFLSRCSKFGEMKTIWELPEKKSFTFIVEAASKEECMKLATDKINEYYD